MIGILIHPPFDVAQGKPKNRRPFRIGKNSRLGLPIVKKLTLSEAKGRILSSLQVTVLKLAVYSYSYRTAKQTRGEKADQVYDVNYRIITPPAEDQNEEREVNKGDEEEWI